MALKRIHKVRPSPTAGPAAGPDAVTEPDRGAPLRAGRAAGRGPWAERGGTAWPIGLPPHREALPRSPPPVAATWPRGAPGAARGRGAPGLPVGSGAGRRRPGAAEAGAARAVLSRGAAARARGRWRPGVPGPSGLLAAPRARRALRRRTRAAFGRVCRGRSCAAVRAARHRS